MLSYLPENKMGSGKATEQTVPDNKNHWRDLAAKYSFDQNLSALSTGQREAYIANVVQMGSQMNKLPLSTEIAAVAWWFVYVFAAYFGCPTLYIFFSVPSWSLGWHHYGQSRGFGYCYLSLIVSLIAYTLLKMSKTLLQLLDDRPRLVIPGVLLSGYMVQFYAIFKYATDPGDLVDIFGFSLFFTIYTLLTFWSIPERHGTRSWVGFQEAAGWDAVEKYLCLEVIKDDLLMEFERTDTNGEIKQCIMGFHPHGSLSLTSSWFPFVRICRRVLPRVQPVVHTASVMHGVFSMRDYFQFVGLRDVSKKTIDQCLLKEGKSSVVVVGGQEEGILHKAQEHVVYLRRSQMGFIKLAVEHKLPLVPIFSFGEDKLLDNIPVPQGIQRFLKRFIGFSALTFPVGRWYLPIIKRTKVTVVFGQPIFPNLTPNMDSSKVLMELNQTYFKEVERIFEKYKGRSGYINHQIKFF